MAAAKNNKYAQKWTPKLIEKLCSELLDFAVEDKTVHFVEFARRKKKTQTWLNAMEEDYPEFSEAYITAQELMAAKLVKASIYGDAKNPNFNGTHAMSWMGVYSNVWKKHMKFKAELARQKEEQIKSTADQIVKAIKEDRLLELLSQKDD